MADIELYFEMFNGALAIALIIITIATLRKLKGGILFKGLRPITIGWAVFAVFELVQILEATESEMVLEVLETVSILMFVVGGYQLWKGLKDL